LLKGISVIGYRFGEEGRRDPSTTKEAWDGFMEMIRGGKIKPVIWKEKYGLDDVPQALQDLQAHRVAGRAVVTIDDKAEDELKARL
jgi:NADPH:quinone reductase-like Zn-dependent oxidoreductase